VKYEIYLFIIHFFYKIFSLDIIECLRNSCYSYCKLYCKFTHLNFQSYIQSATLYNSLLSAQYSFYGRYERANHGTQQFRVSTRKDVDGVSNVVANNVTTFLLLIFCRLSCIPAEARVV